MLLVVLLIGSVRVHAEAVTGSSLSRTLSDSVKERNHAESGLTPDSSRSLACLSRLFDDNTLLIDSHTVPLAFTGRLAIGDLDSDGYADFVVSNRDKLAAYDLCGNQHWQIPAFTNWDHTRHTYWNWTSYGYVGDADGDGLGEFLHLGPDWRTLYVRDGSNGEIKRTIVLPAGPQKNKWMYVGLARRPGETGETATRVVASVMSGKGYHLVSYDIRGPKTRKEWTYSAPIEKAGVNAYAPPWMIDLDGEDGDEIVFGSVALTGHGKEIWSYNPNLDSILGLHTLSVRDIDPNSHGLESVISLYGAHEGQPSMISYKYATRSRESWRAFSPHRERHAHQHTVGDFDLNSPGLETIARNGDGFNHWMVNSNGRLIRSDLRLDPGSDWGYAGEIVQGIEWDKKTGTELLYVERHVARTAMPRLLVTSTHSDRKLTPVFHGGRDSSVDHWYGKDRRPGAYNDGPYEGAAHVVDLFGDGREEILTWGAGKITVYYNPRDANVPKKWGDSDYMQIKKVWTNVYNPR